MSSNSSDLAVNVNIQHIVGCEKPIFRFNAWLYICESDPMYNEISMSNPCDACMYNAHISCKKDCEYYHYVRQITQ